MKEILLVPGPALSNSIDITVMDFPNGDEPRKRCKIKVEYSRPDVLELKNQGKDLEGALQYYREYIYKLVKFHILSEWTAVGGLDESIDIVRARIKNYF